MLTSILRHITTPIYSADNPGNSFEFDHRPQPDMAKAIQVAVIVATLLGVVAATVEDNSGNCNNLGGNWYYDVTYNPGVTCPGNFYYRWLSN